MKRYRAISLLLCIVLWVGLTPWGYGLDHAPPDLEYIKNLDTQTLIIGQYMVYMPKLTQDIYDAAKMTLTEEQGLYYKSEFAGGTWFRINDITEIAEIQLAGNTETTSEAALSTLPYLMHVPKDGEVIFFKETGAAESLFDEKTKAIEEAIAAKEAGIEKQKEEADAGLTSDSYEALQAEIDDLENGLLVLNISAGKAEAPADEDAPILSDEVVAQLNENIELLQQIVKDADQKGYTNLAEGARGEITGILLKKLDNNILKAEASEDISEIQGLNADNSTILAQLDAVKKEIAEAKAKQEAQALLAAGEAAPEEGATELAEALEPTKAEAELAAKLPGGIGAIGPDGQVTEAGRTGLLKEILKLILQKGLKASGDTGTGVVAEQVAGLPDSPLNQLFKEADAEYVKGLDGSLNAETLGKALDYNLETLKALHQARMNTKIRLLTANKILHDQRRALMPQIQGAAQQLGAAIAGTATTGNTGVPTDGSTGTPTDGGTGTPTDGSTGTPTDGSTGTPTDGSTGTPTDGSTGTPTDGSTGTPTDGSKGTPTDGGTGTPTDGSTGTPTDGDTGTATDGGAGAQTSQQAQIAAAAGNLDQLLGKAQLLVSNQQNNLGTLAKESAQLGVYRDGAVQLSHLAANTTVKADLAALASELEQYKTEYDASIEVRILELMEARYPFLLDYEIERKNNLSISQSALTERIQSYDVEINIRRAYPFVDVTRIDLAFDLWKAKRSGNANKIAPFQRAYNAYIGNLAQQKQQEISSYSQLSNWLTGTQIPNKEALLQKLQAIQSGVEGL